MSESFFNLKKKLEDLGYNALLPIDAKPLVECILADLLQTTRSLQHYMNLAKDAFKQRDELASLLEPYKCDNAKLIQENIALSKEVTTLKEKYKKLSFEHNRFKKLMNDEITTKESLISKLQHELRDIGLKALCEDTLSSRNKSRAKVGRADQVIKNFTCSCSANRETCNHINLITELKNTIKNLETRNSTVSDEIEILREQVANREAEIIKLTILLEGGRPTNAVSKESVQKCSSFEVSKLMNLVDELRSKNNYLEKSLKKVLDTQHEAMLRALSLADENKTLQNELAKLDCLALKVEEDCNHQIAASDSEIKILKKTIKTLEEKNHDLEKRLNFNKEQVNKQASSSEFDPLVKEVRYIQETLERVLKEKDTFYDQFKNFVAQQSCPLISLSQDSALCTNYPTKDELKNFLDKERQIYENHITIVQKNLTDIHHHVEQLTKSKNPNNSLNTNDSKLITDLYQKNYKLEEANLRLTEENKHLKTLHESKNEKVQELEETIKHLNSENSDLTQENLELGKNLIAFKSKKNKTEESLKNFEHKSNHDLIEMLKIENKNLLRDKQEYIERYKESCKHLEYLKKELALKQSEFERLEEENCYYRTGARNDHVSSDHLRDECKTLKEQLKKLQAEFIKEKTLVSQIKNIHVETERSSTHINNELLHTQKQLSLCKNNCSALEQQCKDLQSEISTLKLQKLDLTSNIKSIDQEKDKLIIEIDNKVESINALEEKIRSQKFDIDALEMENSELKKKINLSKMTEHKISDFETQIHFLNGEVKRLTQHLDNAKSENKNIQSNLLDITGTLRKTKIEYEKSRKEADSLRHQLQHYVAEVKRIEDILSQKEAERADMLEHFASLSVEANLLESNNQTLENETAHKAAQLQSSWNQIQELETKICEKDNIIDRQSAEIASLHCKLLSLENEVKLLREEKLIYEKNVTYLKKLLQNSESPGISDQKMIYHVTECNLEGKEVEKLESDTERVLLDAKKEILNLKCALQDATSETRELKTKMHKLKKKLFETPKESEFHIPLHETSAMSPRDRLTNEDSDDDTLCQRIKNKLARFTHAGTI